MTHTYLNCLCPKWLSAWPVLEKEITYCSFLRRSQHPGEQADPATAEPEEPASTGPYGKDNNRLPQGSVHPAAGHWINKHHWAIYLRCLWNTIPKLHRIFASVCSFYEQSHFHGSCTLHRTDLDRISISQRRRGFCTRQGMEQAVSLTKKKFWASNFTYIDVDINHDVTFIPLTTA